MNKQSRKFDVIGWMKDNAVMVLFSAISIFCVLLSGMRPSAIIYQLMARIARNAFIIIALIIPIIAGMGINFAITIGAMAAQIAIMLTLDWKIPGIWGFVVSCLLTIPLAGVFGFLIGSLLNKMKGQEMIGSMILGYFANGLYILLFLFIFGTLIPIANPDLTIVGGTGIRNTLDLGVSYGFKGALDNLWKLKFIPAVYWACGLFAAAYLVLFLFGKKKLKSAVIVWGIAAVCALVFSVPAINGSGILGKFKLPDITGHFSMTQVPMATMLLIALLCVMNLLIMRTRLGQKFRAVGQNRAVANAAGINVNRTRNTAIILSTILAGLGQVVFMQNFGAMQTYSAHEQVGLYAGAAILVGGATIARATNGQAILGCVMFHLMFIVAPAAVSAIAGDSANASIEEFFRVFICYGVIALSIVLHGLKRNKSKEVEMKEAGAEA